MSRAVNEHYQAGARENVAFLTSTERRRNFEQPSYSAIPDRNESSGVSSTFFPLVDFLKF